MIKQHWRHIVWVGGAVLAFLIVCGAVFWFDYIVGFNAPAHPDFAGYKPTYLPNNLKVRSQNLLRDHVAGTDQWEFAYEVTLTRDFKLDEFQKSVYEPDITSRGCVSYGDICNIYQTPRGTHYRFWYMQNNSKTFAMEVEWIKGNTLISAYITDEAASKYVGYDWSSVIDGMQEINLSQMRFTQQNRTNSGG